VLRSLFEELRDRARGDAVARLLLRPVEPRPREGALAFLVAVPLLDRGLLLLVVPRTVLVKVPGLLLVALPHIVEDLAVPAGEVAVLAEHLRQKHDVRHLVAKQRLELPDAGRFRAEPAQERLTARSADGVLAEGAREAHPAGREPVDVRRQHDPVAVT